MDIKTRFNKFKTFFLSKKKITIPASLLLVILGFFIFGSNGSNGLHFDLVKKVDLTQSIRATGQVISDTDLDLSFNKSNVIKSVRVKVGDVVVQGQVLATLDQGQVLATLTEARGAVLGAKAKYTKVLEGASDEETALTEVALKNAKTDLENVTNTQNVLVSSAYQNLLNSSVEAISTSSSSAQSAPTISGTYIGNKEGEIKISVYQGGDGGYFGVSGLFNTTGVVSTTTPKPIGDSGLFIQFASTSFNSEWAISIPNKKASDYLTNYNAYQNALKTQSSAVSSAKSLVDQKQAELNLKQAVARNVDVDIAQADVLSAEGALQRAQASYEDTVIRAPAPGTITKVDIKYGELSEIGKAVITLEDVKNLYIEALINESNIAYVKNNQPVSIDFDAFGKEKKFTGTIVHIDPSALTNDGVVNYKIKVSIQEKDETIRPGMNANINVMVEEKKNVLVVPNSTLIKKDGRTYVNLALNTKNNDFEEHEVTTGFMGDNNLVEILNGLSEGEKIFFPK